MYRYVWILILFIFWLMGAVCAITDTIQSIRHEDALNEGTVEFYIVTLAIIFFTSFIQFIWHLFD